MDINASTVSQAYTAAKPAAAGTQGTAQSGQPLPVSQTTQTRQVNFGATSSSPAFVLDISTQILKVEKLSDMSAADQQYWLDQRQQFIDKLEAQGLAIGQEGWGHQLDGKDIRFAQEDGTSKTLRADGYLVTTREDMTPDQQSALSRYFAGVDADRATQSSGTAAGAPSAAPAPAGTATAAASAATPTQSAPATPPSAVPFDSSRYANMPGYSEVKLSDLSAEEQQSLLKARENMKAELASVGRTLDRALGVWAPSGWARVLTTDDRVITYQQDTSHRLTPEQIAQRQAADEQNRRETAAQMAAHEEWGKKWGLGATAWTGPMSVSERRAAEEVAMTEHALRLTRLNISYANGMVHTIARKEKELSAVEPGDAGAATAHKLNEELTAARAQLDEMIRGFREEQQRFSTAYDFKLDGNLVERGADGRFREGTYTLNKSGSGWALRVDSADGTMVSLNDQPFTHDFKRVVVRDIGPSPIVLESPEERAQRVALTG